jgi:OOP family OmpA-OmpF porin
MTHRNVNHAIFSGLLTLVITTFSNSAFAVADQSAYVGGQIGGSKINYTNTDFTPAASNISNNGIAGRIFAGYQFNPNIATEFGYARFHNVNVTVAGNTGSIQVQALDLVLKGMIPMNYGLGVHAEVGPAYMNDKFPGSIKSFFNGIGNSSKERDMTWTVTYGLGLTYEIENVQFDLGWTRYQNHKNVRNVDFAYLGMAFYFA